MKDNIQIRSYKFSIKIIRFCAKLPNEKIYWVMGQQLLRSGTSIGANIVEAKGAASKKDFINFYHIALKSSKETLYWLGLLRDSTAYRTNEVIELLNSAKTISKIISSCLISLKRK